MPFNIYHFDPAEWTGALPVSAERLAGKPPAPMPSEIAQIHETSRWIRAALPTYAQRTDDCTGHAAVNVLEMEIRGYMRPEKVVEIVRYFLGYGVGLWQADGNGAWKMRKDDLKEPYKGGLSLDGPFLALAKRKIIEGDDIHYVESDLRALSLQLALSPVAVGHMVHAGWSKTAKNGAIDGRGELPSPTAGHATAAVNVVRQYQGAEDGWQLYLDFLNSWGRRRWGWNGIGNLMEADHIRSTLGAGVTVCPPLEDPAAWAERILRALGEAGLLIAVLDAEADK